MREANAVESSLDDGPNPGMAFVVGLKPGVDCEGPVVLVDAGLEIPSLGNLVACEDADVSLLVAEAFER